MPKLDRIAHFDERSRQYPVRALLSGDIRRTKRVWKVRAVPLDQGREGACVGFGWSAELASTPIIRPVDNQYALDLYRRAQAEDRAMGHNYPEGASVLAGAKACARSGLVTAYHWAFGVEDVIAALVRKGPVVLGINWYEGMYRTRVLPEGAHLVEVGGELAGGHCIVANGYLPAYAGLGEVVVLTNSWGAAWGDRTGSALLRRVDLERLLREDGEACVATEAPVLVR